MHIQICKLHPNAITPTYGTEGAACFDLYAVEAGFLPARGRAIARTGLAFGVPAGYALDVRSRSGIAFCVGIEAFQGTYALDVRSGSGIAFCGGIEAFQGTLDSDYTGELLVLLFNHSDQPYGFGVGERIAQARIVESPRVEFRVVEQLALTERGAQGFGHTGK